MIDPRSDFIHWYFDEFRLDELYLDMDMTSEESPWHRERTVGVHTDMVVTQYLTQTPSNWDIGYLCGAFAAAFHDTGKPDTMEVCFREDRGEYKRFAGHEPISARLWEDWAVRNWNMLERRFFMTFDDIFKVGFIIEHHLPYGLKQKDKVDNLLLTLLTYNIDDAFVYHLLADTHGRISDDMEEKIANTDQWIENFGDKLMAISGHSALFTVEPERDQPILWVPIGASGSGKTTFRQDLSANVFSLDDMRIELYGEPYDEAFLKSTKDKHFRSTCNERYREQLRLNQSLFLDNTNTSRKARRFYITEARNRGYYIRAVLMPIMLETAQARQKTREDKTLPDEIVRQQYMRICLPQIGEVDSIYTYAGNIVS